MGNKRDNDNIQDVVSQCDMQPERCNYEESADYAQLDGLLRVPIDANYQSLVKTRDQMRLDKCDNYEISMQRYQFSNMRSNPKNDVSEEGVYEEVQRDNAS